MKLDQAKTELVIAEFGSSQGKRGVPQADYLSNTDHVTSIEQF